jgi:hypothetical protein
MVKTIYPQWTTEAIVNYYFVLQLLIGKDGAAFASEWVEGLTEWKPALAFASGTYQWTVQPWSPSGFGRKSAPAQFVVLTTGAATPPAAIDPAGTLPGATGVNFTWTRVPGVRWYRLIIEREGEVFAVQWLDGLNTWTPDFAFVAGTYQWKVQPWSSAGYGLVSNLLAFSYGVPSSSGAPALTAAATGTPVPAGLSSAATPTGGQLEKLPASVDTGADPGAAASIALSAVYAQPFALTGFAAAQTGAASQDIPLQPLTLEEINTRGKNDFVQRSAIGDGTVSIAQTAGYVFSAVQDEDLTLQAISAAGSPQNDSGNPATSADNQTADDGNPVLNQTQETDIDLVSAKRGYIAPIDIVVGPMNDPILKQHFRPPDKKLEDQPDGT